MIPPQLANLEAAVAKNIVLLSDGTGNSAAKLFKTNVWRLYEALDRSDPTKQVAYYDDGIGTSSFRPLAVLGGVFGYGLKRNVLDLYRFLCRNYEDGDRVYCFGFSRGAFTARVLAGLISRQGVVKKTAFLGDESRLASEAAAAYRDFRKLFNVTQGLVSPLRRLRDAVIGLWHEPAERKPIDSIQFVGVWDTVAAYGGPIEEITRAIDHWVWPLSMPDRIMSGKIQRACHAIALDDERNAFHPVLWNEDLVHGANGPRGMYEHWSPPREPRLPAIDQQRLSQVWFAGMHSDVGGGYAQDGLSYKTLDWMIDRASVYGLLLEPGERSRLRERAHHFDKVNDSRKGVVGGYYRYKPRKMADILATATHKPTLGHDFARMRDALRSAKANGPENMPGRTTNVPMIHESVFERIESQLDGYAPIVLPDVYRVATHAGDVKALTDEELTRSAERAVEQEHAWNWAWGRRVVYFATVLASLFLVALPWINTKWPPGEEESPLALLVPVIDFAGGFLPGLASRWIDAFGSTPGRFALGASVVAALLFVGGRLEGRISDEMRRAWHPNISDRRRDDPRTGRLYKIRTSKYYRGFFYAMTHWILPTSFALIFYAAAVVAIVRAFRAASHAFAVM